MRTFRLFFKGSQRERRYLMSQLRQGYALESINLGLYRFKKIEASNSPMMSVEFVEKSMLKGDFFMEGVDAVSLKPLWLSNYAVMYSYFDNHDWQKISVSIDESLHITYIKEALNRLFVIKMFFIILFACVWGMTIYYDTPKLYSFMSMGVVFLSWMMTGMCTHKLTQRLELVSGESSAIAIERSVIIKNITGKPDLSLLKFLGSWNYVSFRRNKCFCRLSSRFSEDRIREEVASFLNIPAADIQIIDHFGLFPVGWLF